MSAVRVCGEWLIITCDQKLVAVHRKENREAFEFDCSTAEKSAKHVNDGKPSDGGTSEDTGNDTILACAVSGSGKLLAFTDDTKRLILFHSEPSWHCISTRWVARRGTSLVFSCSEDELLVADKSGDVYSFSVMEPLRDGELKMGHLSMLLAMTISPDNKYIITADRDEKIRVGFLRSPYNIQSFCLGHQHFVSALVIPSGRPRWLLSGSGDGTVKLWDYESGRKLQSCDLQRLDHTASSEDPTVNRITCSPDSRHVAVQCEGVSTVEIFTLDQQGKERLVPHSSLSLPHRPLDITFDPEGLLWVLMDCSDTPFQIYTYSQSSWECPAENPDLNRVTQAFRPTWEARVASVRTNSNFGHLHKTSFDNVSVYLQKKQQRLEEQQLKRTNTQRPSDSKKPKKETSACETRQSV